MSASEHFIFVNSTFSSENHFGIDLPSTLQLEGNWKCALIECSFKFFNKDLPNIPRVVFLLADFCTSSFINEKFLPVLRKLNLPRKTSISIIPPSSLYVPIKQEWVNRLEFSVHDLDLNVLNVNEKTEIEFTLHFKKF
jgi:hypothetical protein